MSLGFYFDGTRCVGCKACQVACKDRFNLQKAGPRPRRVTTIECGTYPDAGMYHTSISCNHCDSPACVANCPTGAMFQSDDGTVQHDDNVCIGCKTCMSSCPYGAPQYAEEIDLIVKCDSCKPLRAAGMNPVCVDACPMRALDFGEMDDLRAAYGDNLVSEIACLPPADITSPNLVMKAKEEAQVEDFREVEL